MNLTVSLPIVLGIFYASQKKIHKIALLGIASLLIVTIILTFSRMGMMQLIIVLFFSLGIRLLKKYKTIGFFIFGIVLI